MTRKDYENVTIGTPISEVIADYGQPLTINTRPDGSQSYEYVERLPVSTATGSTTGAYPGSTAVVENRYFIIVKDGKVISKRYNFEEPPAYDQIYDEDPNDVPE